MMDTKRGRASSAKDDGKLTKRQRRAAAQSAKHSYHKAKPAISHSDTPLEELLPHQRIDLIADLSEAVLEDPTAAVSSSRTTISTEQDETQYHKTQSKLQTLLNLASPSTNGHDGHAARLAILSLLAIFQDILPSYRIRLPTESEMAVRVSKEIKQTWDYERKLLQSYQRYLQLLEKTWESGKWGNQMGSVKVNRGGSPTTLAATAMLSLSQLLTTGYNFNFRTNILQLVVRQGNNRSNDEIRMACCNALIVMFEKDVQGEASLEAVRKIAKMLKEGGKGGKGVHPDLLNTWISLPLRVHEDEAMAGEKQHFSIKRSHHFSGLANVSVCIYSYHVNSQTCYKSKEQKG